MAYKISYDWTEVKAGVVLAGTLVGLTVLWCALFSIRCLCCDLLCPRRCNRFFLCMRLNLRRKSLRRPRWQYRLAWILLWLFSIALMVTSIYFSFDTLRYFEGMALGFHNASLSLYTDASLLNMYYSNLDPPPNGTLPKDLHTLLAASTHADSASTKVVVVVETGVELQTVITYIYIALMCLSCVLMACAIRWRRSLVRCISIYLLFTVIIATWVFLGVSLSSSTVLTDVCGLATLQVTNPASPFSTGVGGKILTCVRYHKQNTTQILDTLAASSNQVVDEITRFFEDKVSVNFDIPKAYSALQVYDNFSAHAHGWLVGANQTLASCPNATSAQASTVDTVVCVPGRAVQQCTTEAGKWSCQQLPDILSPEEVCDKLCASAVSVTETPVSTGTLPLPNVNPTYVVEEGCLQACLALPVSELCEQLKVVLSQQLAGNTLQVPGQLCKTVCKSQVGCDTVCSALERATSLSGDIIDNACLNLCEALPDICVQLCLSANFTFPDQPNASSPFVVHACLNATLLPFCVDLCEDSIRSILTKILKNLSFLLLMLDMAVEMLSCAYWNFLLEQVLKGFCVSGLDETYVVAWVSFLHGIVLVLILVLSNLVFILDKEHDPRSMSCLCACTEQPRCARCCARMGVASRRVEPVAAATMGSNSSGENATSNVSRPGSTGSPPQRTDSAKRGDSLEEANAIEMVGLETLEPEDQHDRAELKEDAFRTVLSS
eukprot:g43299.t1